MTSIFIIDWIDPGKDFSSPSLVHHSIKWLDKIRLKDEKSMDPFGPDNSQINFHWMMKEQVHVEKEKWIVLDDFIGSGIHSAIYLSVNNILILN